MATLKQKISKFLYPLIKKVGKVGKNGTVLRNESDISPNIPFNTHRATLNNGRQIDFSEFSGKKILIVNTASNCGYTAQYAELQSLHEKLGNRLAIVAFPANDFLEQEKGSDTDIAQFCQVNYGVTFPIAQKSTVVKNEGQNPIFKWLSDSAANGWNGHGPDWNFSKYIIDEQGKLQYYFGPSISPLDAEFLEAVS